VSERAGRSFNGLKWENTGSDGQQVTRAIQGAFGLSWNYPAGGSGVYSGRMTSAGKWELRGDFLIRVRVTGGIEPFPILPAGGSGPLEDTAFWLGVVRPADGGLFRVKRCRTASIDGFAVEHSSDGQSIARFNGLDGHSGGAGYFGAHFDLVLQRTGGQMKGLVIIPPGPQYPEGLTWWIWPSEVSFPGILELELGARLPVPFQAGQRVFLESLTAEWGRHSYSPVASWRREWDEGVFLDDFAGDTLDPKLWTRTTSGGGRVAPQPGLDAAPGSGLLFEGEDDGDRAMVESPGITGDFSFTAKVRLPEDLLVLQGALGGTNSVLGLMALTGSQHPRAWIEVVEEASEQSLKVRVQVTRAGLPDLDVAEVSLPSWAGDARFTFGLKRTGPLSEFWVEREGGEEVLRAQVEGLFQLPTTVRMFQAVGINGQMHLTPLPAYSAPCLLVFHSPSPGILTPVMSTSRCRSSRLGREGMLTVSFF
jgi:hypothetical protein